MSAREGEKRKRKKKGNSGDSNWLQVTQGTFDASKARAREREIERKREKEC